MRKNRLFPSTTSRLTLLILLAASVTKSTGIDSGSVRIEILYTQNTNGVLENCDCPGTPLGGLDKRMTLMKRLANKDSVAALYLDGGDLLSAKGFPAKDRFILRAYSLIGYDAIGMGDQEFINGTQFLRELNLHLRLPFLSSSIISDESVMPSPTRSMVKTIAGIRFGLLSVVGKEPFELMDDDKTKGVEIGDYRNDLSALIKSMKEKADIIILLSHLGHSEDIKAAKEFSGIDIIIGAHSQSLLSTPERYGNTIIVQAGKNTEFVGQLTLTIDKRSKKIKSANGILHPVLKDLPGDPRLQGLIATYQKLIASDFKESPWPSIASRAAEFVVVENERCTPCHQQEGAAWQKTKHAEAYRALSKLSALGRSECISCHTTGFGGTDSTARTIASEGGSAVGCVECHGVSPEHLHGGKGMVEAITEHTCVRCHAMEIDPVFRYAASMASIRHNAAAGQEYIVQEGDSLSKIALRRYSDARLWRRIYEVNKTLIKNPNLIFPRQVFRLPS